MGASKRNRMPLLFVGHGSPINIVDDNLYTQNFNILKAHIPKPKAIVCISAHWVTRGTQVLSSSDPKQIFDFHGFPEELYQIHYSPPGAPQLADEITRLNPNIQSSQNWGLDHGTWAVLCRLYPEANIPTLQLSLDVGATIEERFQIGTSLKALREQGVLILASGNLVHNLSKIQWQSDAPPHSWATEFETFVLSAITDKHMDRLEKAQTIFRHPQIKTSHPTLDHLWPLVYILGAQNSDDQLQVISQGIQNSAISMATIRLAPFSLKN